jgi:8-amino-7-oxononanoate synthase
MKVLPAALTQPDPTHVFWRGRKLIYFGGCDYLRLSWHPKVRASLTRGLNRWGMNVAASRKTTGNHPLYEKLERALAAFFQAERAVLVSSGYASNLVVAQALAGDFSHVLIDARAHTSLRDASRFFEAPVHLFHHRQPRDLTRVLKRLGTGIRPILLTDGLFSHDGSTAPLRDYLKGLPPRGRILVDDAHAAGIMGDSGRGTLEWEGVPRTRVIQTITLSKAFGTYGGAILCSEGDYRKIVEKSFLFAGNTPIPLPLAEAALTALAILKSEPGLRERLRSHVRLVQERLNEAGLLQSVYPGPILSLQPPDPRAESRHRKALLEAGIYPSLIDYPGGPKGGYYRFAVSSAHRPAQLRLLADVLIRIQSGPGKRSPKRPFTL